MLWIAFAYRIAWYNWLIWYGEFKCDQSSQPDIEPLVGGRQCAARPSLFWGQWVLAGKGLEHLRQPVKM